MDLLATYQTIRRIAKEDLAQQDFAFFKDLRIPIFKNSRDLTSIQRVYLSYLMFYGNLNLDVALGDAPEKIFECEIFEDAYSTFKRNESVKKTKSSKEDLEKVRKKSTFEQKETKAERPIGWVFK